MSYLNTGTNQQTYAYSTPKVIVGAVLNEEDDASYLRVITKTNTSIAVGDLLYWDTDGFAPATQTIVAAATNSYAYYVATEAVTAKTATQYYVRVVTDAIIGVSAVFTSGAAKRGCKVRVSATAGKVSYHTKPTDAATSLYGVGTLYGDIASGDVGAWVDMSDDGKL